MRGDWPRAARLGRFVAPRPGQARRAAWPTACSWLRFGNGTLAESHLQTTSNTCTITATDAQAMAQDRDAFIAIKQGIKPFCPDHAEDHDDELVKTPVQVISVFVLEVICFW